jgi:hypothetical protein
MESVPGAVATGLTLASSNDAAANDRLRTRLRLYPVATAPGTDLMLSLLRNPRPPFPQNVFLNLAGGGLGKLENKCDCVWRFEVREVGARELA